MRRTHGTGVSAPLVVVGLMSGTSADGIDAAVVEIGWPPSLDITRRVSVYTRPYSTPEREQIFALFESTQASVGDVCAMNFTLGEWFAEAAQAAIEAAQLSASNVDLIGSHGQTIFHAPPDAAKPHGGAGGRAGVRRRRGAGGALTASTLQIGEPSVIAERTGITTVADFRVRDMAAGGHGAPLVSYVDALLFQHATRTRAVLNLGGIANVTVLPPVAETVSSPIAFDTGPGNMVLDWLAGELTGGAQRYDDGGRLAASGQGDDALLSALLADPYFSAQPPKTTGRERYGAAFARSLLSEARARGLGDEDVMATVLALTVETVARGIESTALTHGKVTEVIAGGGGTQNPALMDALRRRLAGVLITTHEDHGLPSQAKEAVSFAILAAAAIRGETNTLPSCTGARNAVVMGKIVPGRNYRDVLRKALNL